MKTFKSSARKETAVAALLGVLALATLVVAGRWSDRADATDPAPRAEAEEERRLLAVLPLRDLSPGGESYFSRGLTDELITRLGQIDPRRLGVIARTSAEAFARRHPSGGLETLGEVLGADYLLEGSVRHADGRVRIALLLASVDDQVQIWSGIYERSTDDVIGVQSEVARAVAGALAEELPGLDADATAERPPDPAAFRAFLQGTHLSAQGGAEALRAEDYLRRAVEIDPGYARAWIELADLYRHRRPFDPANLDRAEEHARHALHLRPDWAEPHLELGMIAFYNRHDLAAATHHLERALELNPSHAHVRHNHAALRAVQGRVGEARDEIRTALELSPLSLAVQSDLGWFAMYDRDPEAAAGHLRATLEVAQGSADYWARRGLLGVLAITGRWQEAAELVTTWPQGLEAAVAVEPVPGDPRATVDAFLRREIERLVPLYEARMKPPTDIAVNLALLGDAEGALDWLERAEREGWGWQLPFLRIDPRLDALRSHPRFRALVERLGLPDPARAADRPGDRRR